MSDMLDHISTYLASLGIATVGTDLFLGTMPDTPDTCTALHEYAGPAPNYTHGDLLPFEEHPRLQVMTRSATYTTARNKAEAIYRALGGVSNLLLSGCTYYRIMPLQQPGFIGKDQNARTQFTVNFQISKETGPL